MNPTVPTGLPTPLTPTDTSSLIASSVTSAGNSMVNLALQKTRLVAESFWAGDLEGFFRYAADDIVCVGQDFGVLVVGKSQARSAFASHKNRAVTPHAIQNERLVALTLDETSCVVVAQHQVAPQEPGGPKAGTSVQGEAISVVCTLVWHQEEDLMLKTMHLSRSSSQATAATRAAQRKYGVPKAARLPLQAHDSAGTVHWVSPDNVIYVSAAHQYTNVFCTDRLIRLRASFTKVLEQLGDTVVRIHRSYAVNPSYASHLEGEMLYLTTGSKVPVPAKRVREVREALALRFDKLGTVD